MKVTTPLENCDEVLITEFGEDALANEILTALLVDKPGSFKIGELSRNSVAPMLPTPIAVLRLVLTEVVKDMVMVATTTLLEEPPTVENGTVALTSAVNKIGRAHV